jgi:hypothetical protein
MFSGALGVSIVVADALRRISAVPNTQKKEGTS